MGRIEEWEGDVHDAGQEDDGELEALASLHAHQVPDHFLCDEEDAQVAYQVDDGRSHRYESDLHAFPRDPRLPRALDGLAVEYHQEDDDDVVEQVDPDQTMDDEVRL